MLELVIVVVIAAIGMLVIGRAFASASTGTERTQVSANQTAKKEKQQVAAKSTPKAAATVTAKATKAKASANPSPSPKSKPTAQANAKNSKKQAAARAAEEAEMDRIIFASGKSHSGMSTDKAKVISLASIQKQDTVTSKKEVVQVSTKQRLIEAEEGFAIVEKKDKAPSQKFRKEKAKKKEEQTNDKNLNNFFKSQDAKGRAGKGVKKDDDKESKPTGTVNMRKKITSDAKNTWASNDYSE